jgi:hypothetical protein
MINHSESEAAMTNTSTFLTAQAFQSFQKFLPLLATPIVLVTSYGWVTPSSSVAAELPTTGSFSSSQELPASAELPDGTYLFGDVPTPDQMGSGYVVFTQKNGQVVGALFHPNADFSCFSGVQQNQQLYITAYSLGDEPWRTQVSLPRMHIIPKLNEGSLKTLSICHQEMAQLDSNVSLTAKQPPSQPITLPSPGEE